MTEHKFTDDEIIRALECCVNNDSCKECPINPNYGNYGYCTNLALTHALDLINRQNAEIERLKNLLDCYEETSGNKKAKAEAIKEFAERLKEKAYIPKPYGMAKVVDVYSIDNLVKEMTEGKE